MTDRTPPGDGAQAEYYLARAADVARDPASVDRARAAVTPASALAAWQWLIDRAPIAAGQPPAWAASPSKSPAGEAPRSRAGPRCRRRHRLPVGRLSISV